MTAAELLAVAGLAGWLYLLGGRGLFWLARERDDARPAPPPLADWPAVVAIVPARNEADVIARSIGSLLAQDYPGALEVILIDDGSDDGTAAAARAAAGDTRLSIVCGAAPPSGWTGKLWAVRQGVHAACAGPAPPDFLLLTDADIAHAGGNLRRLVERARAGDLVLTSLMAKLTVETWAEKLLVPAFVFFFAMLYPFAWVNDARRKAAAAAGGCMLVSRPALEAAGGIEAIAGKIIDDCALAALLKRRGPIWLGLTERARSLRPYETVGAMGAMVARSAYAQLNYSPLLLAATIAGMGLLYVAPPLIAVFGAGAARLAAVAAWLAMAGANQPMLRFYRLGFWRGAFLPAIGAAYVVFTIASAIAVWRGRGGMWKGRSQAMSTSA